MKIKQLLLALPLVVASYGANAQSAAVVGTCGTITYDAGGQRIVTQDTTGKLCVNATVSATATIAAFAPVGTNNAIAVTSTTARTALTGAATNSTTLVENSGATDVFVAFGDNTVTVTAANGTRVPAGWGIAFNIGTATNIAYITASSTSTISATTGTGLPALGAAGSGGSSAITTWAGGTLGAMANYGSSPGAVLVPGVNAFVTNSNTNDAKSIANSSPVTAATINVGPTDCSSTVVTGGTAVNAITAGSTLHGAMIQNIDTSEGMWISLTGTAAASTAGSYFLQPGSTTVQGGTYTTPIGFGFNTNLSVVAATNGHKFTCTKW